MDTNVQKTIIMNNALNLSQKLKKKYLKASKANFIFLKPQIHALRLLT